MRYFTVIVFLYVLLVLGFVNLSLAVVPKAKVADKANKEDFPSSADTLLSSLSYKEKIVLLGNKLVGTKYKRFRYKDKSFRGDCSGFVQFLFATQQKSLIDFTIKTTKQDSLAHRLYASFRRTSKARFHKSSEPKVGDIVFFHNTYDQNANNKLDDLNTHVGVVTKTDPLDGTVYFVHYLNKRVGVKKHKLNLREPHSISKNSFIRDKRRHPHSKGYYLTGELFAYFVTVLE